MFFLLLVPLFFFLCGPSNPYGSLHQGSQAAAPLQRCDRCATWPGICLRRGFFASARLQRRKNPQSLNWVGPHIEEAGIVSMHSTICQGSSVGRLTRYWIHLRVSLHLARKSCQPRPWQFQKSPASDPKWLSIPASEAEAALSTGLIMNSPVEKKDHRPVMLHPSSFFGKLVPSLMPDCRQLGQKLRTIDQSCP